jgi:hypothetical protein
MRSVLFGAGLVSLLGCATAVGGGAFAASGGPVAGSSLPSNATTGDASTVASALADRYRDAAITPKYSVGSKKGTWDLSVDITTLALPAVVSVAYATDLNFGVPPGAKALAPRAYFVGEEHYLGTGTTLPSFAIHIQMDRDAICKKVPVEEYFNLQPQPLVRKKPSPEEPIHLPLKFTPMFVDVSPHAHVKVVVWFSDKSELERSVDLCDVADREAPPITGVGP